MRVFLVLVLLFAYTIPSQLLAAPYQVTREMNKKQLRAYNVNMEDCIKSGKGAKKGPCFSSNAVDSGSFGGCVSGKLKGNSRSANASRECYDDIAARFRNSK